MRTWALCLIAALAFASGASARGSSSGKTADVEFAGIVPGKGLGPEDFADGGLPIVPDPSLYLITDDPVGVLTRAAANWEVPGTMIKFRVVGPNEGCVVKAQKLNQAARATVGRPGWGASHTLVMTLDVPFSRGDDTLVAVVTHEMGHWLGFDHSFLGETVMFPVLTNRINWVDPDQTAKLVARYGVGPNALAEVRGRITRHGQPLSGARVNLLGANGRTAFATFAGSDGVYHVPVWAGTYRLFVDPNDGPAVAGNFIGTYPGGPLDFATAEAADPVVVSAGDDATVDFDVPDGDAAFKITTAEPHTVEPGYGTGSVKIYYSGAAPSEIAGVECLSPDVRITQVSDVGGEMEVFFDVDPLALPGPRAFRLRKTNGAFAIVPGLVGIVAPMRLRTPFYGAQLASGSPVEVSWDADRLPLGPPSRVDVSASLDGGLSWRKVGQVDGRATSFTWDPGPAATPELRVRIEAFDSTGGKLALDESIFNVGVGLPARGEVATGPDVTPPSVHVTSPNGGEALVAGEAAEISWTASDDVAVASQLVEASADGGRHWTAVATPGVAARSASWTPDAKATDELLVRVTVRDLAGNEASDASDAAARVVVRPSIASVALKPKGAGYVLRVRGAGLGPGAEVRVNGAATGVAPVYDAARGTLKLKGDAAALRLNAPGAPNTIVVVVAGLASAEATF